jgi:Bacterial Ig domain
VDRTWIGRSVVATLVILGPLAVSCGDDNSSGGGGPSLKIASPSDGASVSEPFTLKFDASVPLGPLSSGDDHVHVCVDGASCDTGNYEIAYGDSYQVTGLPSGMHTIEASLRNADHSAAGATATITVTITGAGGVGGSPSPSDGGKGYG